MNGTLAVARYTLVELTRRRILLVFFALGAVGTLVLGVGLKVIYSVAGATSFAGRTEDPARLQRLLEASFISDLYGALGIFALLIAFAIGMTAIYHDLDSGAAVSIFSKPVTRIAFTAGKVGAAVAALVVIVGVLAIEARLVMLLFSSALSGSLPDSLTGEVIATLANTVLLMLLVLALSTVMNNIVAATVAFVYYDVVTGVIVAVHTLAHSAGFGNAVVRGIFDVLYWLVPHELISSAPGDLARAELTLSNSDRSSQTLALIPPASGAGDIVWWAFLVVVLAAACYLAVRRRQV